MAGNRRPGRRAQHRVVVAVAAVLGAVLAASPTGTPVVDELWCAAFAGFLAWIGAFARREVALVAAAGAAAVATTTSSLGFAALAVALAGLNALRPRGARRLNGAAAGAVALALVTGSGPEGRWLAALTTAVLAGALVWAGLMGTGRRRQRLVRRGALALGGAMAVAVVLAGVGGALARPGVDRGTDGFRAAREAARSGDIEAATARFRAAGDALSRGRGYLQSLALPARAVPGLAQQVQAGTTAVDAAADAAAVARRASSKLSLEALRFEGGAIDLATLADAEAPLGELIDGLDRAVQRLERIDRALLLGPVSDLLDDGIAEAVEAGQDAERLRRGVQVAPSLLGGDGARRYLVLFTTPVEARNRFGFPGTYAVLAFDQGRLAFEQSGPVQDLFPPDGFDQAALTVPVRAQPYLAYGVSREWRSVTIPAHFPAVADLASQLAAQSPIGPVDGVVVADPETVAAIVGLVGDVALPELDVVLTPETTVDFVARRQYLEFPQGDQQAERKDLLADIAEVVGIRLETVSLPPLGELTDVFSPLLDADHLALGVPASPSPEAAALLAETGADGGFGPFDGDVVHVGHLNAVGNKIDLFLERNLTYDVVVAGDGSLTAVLRLDLTNTAPGTGLPDYLIGSALDEPLPKGTNRTTVLLYSPHVLEGLEIDGVPLPFVALADGDLFVYQVQLDLGPGQARVVTARLSGTVGPEPYRLTVMPNGLATPDEATVQITDARTGRERTESTAVESPWVVTTGSG